MILMVEDKTSHCIDLVVIAAVQLSLSQLHLLHHGYYQPAYTSITTCLQTVKLRLLMQDAALVADTASTAWVLLACIRKYHNILANCKAKTAHAGCCQIT